MKNIQKPQRVSALLYNKVGSVQCKQTIQVPKVVENKQTLQQAVNKQVGSASGHT